MEIARATNEAPVYCRIDGILAEGRKHALIFRRGPSDYYQMLLWNLETDSVESGQWIKADVKTKRCDLSHDGRFAVVCAFDYSPRRKDGDGGWIAASFAPYFSALTVWHAGYLYTNQGAIWVRKCELKLYCYPDTEVKGEKLPRWLKVSCEDIRYTTDRHYIFDRLLRRGWRFIDDGVVRRQLPRGYLQLEFVGWDETWSIHAQDGTVIRSWSPSNDHPQWLDADYRDRIILGMNGCLYAWENFPDGEPTLVADLNANRFQAIAPPPSVLKW